MTIVQEMLCRDYRARFTLAGLCPLGMQFVEVVGWFSAVF